MRWYENEIRNRYEILIDKKRGKMKQFDNDSATDYEEDDYQQSNDKFETNKANTQNYQHAEPLTSDS